MDLKSVIITGASDGIGKEMAYAFARRGYSLGILARRWEKLAEVKAESLRLGAKAVFAHAADVTDKSLLRSHLRTLDQELGGSQIFVANAGIDQQMNPDKDEFEVLERLMAVNYLSAVNGIEMMKMLMRQRGSGTLAAVSSVASAKGLPRAGGYCASKSALHAYLEALRFDLLPSGLKVVEICPGFVQTEMTQKIHSPKPFIQSAEKTAEIFVQGILKQKRIVIAPWQFRFVFPILKYLPEFIYFRIGILASKKIPEESHA